jgi:hypothetical protein
VARYWRPSSTKSKKQKHVTAPAARFTRKVITTLHEVSPLGTGPWTWSLARYKTLTPDWPQFAGPQVFQEFASYTELRESAFDLLLGRDDHAAQSPGLSRVASSSSFRLFPTLPSGQFETRVLAPRMGIQVLELQCEAAGQFGFIRVPSVHEFCIENWVRRRISDPDWRDSRLKAPVDRPFMMCSTKFRDPANIWVIIPGPHW